MDFVVIGLGLSALALLTGLTLLCLVAPRWLRKAGVAQPGEVAYARAHAGERHALGQGFLCVGAVLLLSTLGGISAGLGDKAGAYLVATMTTLTVLGLLGWDLLYRRQHPIPTRRRVAAARPTRDTQDARPVQLAASPATAPTSTTTVRRRVLPARQRVVPAAQHSTAMTAPSAMLNDDAHHLVADEQPPAEDLEATAVKTVPEVALTHSGAPTTQDHEPDIEKLDTGDLAAATHPIDPRDDDFAGEPTDGVTAGLSEAVSPETENANGAADPGLSTLPLAEPDALPYGDDRVIELFPTAAARRSRIVVAPPDPDGQS